MEGGYLRISRPVEFTHTSKTRGVKLLKKKTENSNKEKRGESCQRRIRENQGELALREIPGISRTRQNGSRQFSRNNERKADEERRRNNRKKTPDETSVSTPDMKILPVRTSYFLMHCPIQAFETSKLLPRIVI